MKAITIHNPLKVSFTHAWDKQPITLAAQASQLMEDWLAEHMAKHLVDFMLNEKGLPTDHHSRAELLKQVLPGGRSVEAENSLMFNQAMLNQESDSPSLGQAATVTDEAVVEKKKPGRPKAKAKTEEAKVDEKDFAGINA